MKGAESRKRAEGFENSMDSDATSKQPSGASEESSLRFNVNQVHLDPNEADEKEDHSPRMDFPEPESPGSPLSHDATSTIGYATHDAVPMTVFYRNENSNSNTTKKSRPTLRELRKGFEEDHEQQVCEQFPAYQFKTAMIFCLVRTHVILLSNKCMTNNTIFPSNSRANRFEKKLSFCFGNTRYRVHKLHRRFFAI